MNPFHDQKCSVLFCIETSCSSLTGAKGGRSCRGGREEGYVICYVCMCVVKYKIKREKKKERKMLFKEERVSYWP